MVSRERILTSFAILDDMIASTESIEEWMTTKHRISIIELKQCKRPTTGMVHIVPPLDSYEKLSARLRSVTLSASTSPVASGLGGPIASYGVGFLGDLFAASRLHTPIS
jgi:hypothetical protein